MVIMRIITGLRRVWHQTRYKDMGKSSLVVRRLPSVIAICGKSKNHVGCIHTKQTQNDQNYRQSP